MLYVFHVDAGRMYSFDMNVALSSVENLKETIERLHNIPASSIVLLVSGGEMLTQTTQVSYYSAGTDTNPIYMFLNGNAKSTLFTYVSDTDEMHDQINRAVNMPVGYEALEKRAQLAAKMHELARDYERSCERMIHDQHLQQHGWCAVVANLEDLTSEFTQRFKNFSIVFEKHLEQRPRYLELLKNFGTDLAQLSRIPILPGLMQLAQEDFHAFDEFLQSDEVFSSSQQKSVIANAGAGQQEVASNTTPNKKLKMGEDDVVTEQPGSSEATLATLAAGPRPTLTLLQWISAKENHNSLQLMANECQQCLATFTQEVYNKLRTEINVCIKSAKSSELNEIRGLSDRLMSLEQVKSKIETAVQSQKEHSTSLQQNHQRAMTLRDNSVLPDLCASHESQLILMYQTHQRLREHRRGVSKAKEELGSHLDWRLTNIVKVENLMAEFDNRLLFYHRCIRRAENHMHIIEQVHHAPNIYVAAVAEVVRRRIFSGEFRQWASKLAGDFNSIHNEEIKRRQLFNSTFEGHFLNILFPGMNDMPPAFANENPLVFDAQLPSITKSDIELLSSYLPDLKDSLTLPDMSDVINFFDARATREQQQITNELESSASQDSEQINTVIIDANAMESEPNANAPRSISTSTAELRLPTMSQSTSTEKQPVQSVETLTDAHMLSDQAEIHRLRKILQALWKLSADALKLSRDRVAALREDAQAARDIWMSDFATLRNNMNEVILKYDQQQQTNAQKTKQIIAVRDNELETLKTQAAQQQNELQSKCENLEKQLENLQSELQNIQLEKERAVEAIKQQLSLEHKQEMESLRSRYKLMSQMERSPSDAGNLEGAAAERPPSRTQDVIELAQHEAICAQIRAELSAAKDREFASALETERTIWHSMNSESVMANVSVLKDMLEEKERQLEMLREKDLMLTKENYQIKTRLDALLNEDGSSWMQEKIEYLIRDRCRLEEELNMEKTRRVEMETSFATVRSSASDSPGSLQTPSTSRSKSSSSAHKHIMLDTCKEGDIVLIVWSVRHRQFIVVQESPYHYFVHAESLEPLNLQLPSAKNDEEFTILMPYVTIGRVIDKEYCQARKEKNSYRVAKGTKFYRVKLNACPSNLTARLNRLESIPMTISCSTSHCSVQTQLNSLGTNTADAATAAAASNDAVDAATASVNAAAAVSILQQMSTTTEMPSMEDAAEVTAAAAIVNFTTDAAIPGRARKPPAEKPTVLESLEQTTTTTATKFQPPQSVITEQPTAVANNLEFDLLLALGELSPTASPVGYASATAAAMRSSTERCSSAEEQLQPGSPFKFQIIASSEAINAPPQQQQQQQQTEGAIAIPSSSFGASEDSDEYRSLETKDDIEFNAGENEEPQ